MASVTKIISHTTDYNRLHAPCMRAVTCCVSCCDVLRPSAEHVVVLKVLVCHVVHAPHVALVRGVERQVGHVRGVEACKALDLCEREGPACGYD